jgi:hypothetical protein
MLFQRRIWATRIIKKAGIPILPKKGRVLINLLIATAKQAPKETSPAKATLVAALSVAQSKAAAASPLALQNALAELPQAAIEVAKEYGMTDFAEWAENDQRVFKACQLGSNAAESVNAEIEA